MSVQKSFRAQSTRCGAGDLWIKIGATYNTIELSMPRRKSGLLSWTSSLLLVGPSRRSALVLLSVSDVDESEGEVTYVRRTLWLMEGARGGLNSRYRCDSDVHRYFDKSVYNDELEEAQTGPRR
jgi:hypothetical protein